MFNVQCSMFSPSPMNDLKFAFRQLLIRSLPFDDSYIVGAFDFGFWFLLQELPNFEIIMGAAAAMIVSTNVFVK